VQETDAPFGAGETRQIFAKQVDGSGSGGLFRLPDGEADLHRAAARSGQLVCPFPGCEQPALTTRGGQRRHHFVHMSRVATAHSPERWYHLVGKVLLTEQLRRRYPTSTVEVEQLVPETSQRADVLLTSARSGRRAAVEIQYSAITLAEWQRRTDLYASAEIPVTWVFGHLPPHRRRIRGTIGEKTDATQNTTLLRHVTSGGGDVWLLDPDTRSIAYVFPDADYARIGNVKWVTGSDETGLLILPLTQIELSPDGHLQAEVVERIKATPDWAVLDERRAQEATAAALAAAEFDTWLDQKPGRRELHATLTDSLRTAEKRRVDFAPSKIVLPDHWRMVIVDALDAQVGDPLKLTDWDQAARTAASFNVTERESDAWLRALVSTGVIEIIAGHRGRLIRGIWTGRSDTPNARPPSSSSPHHRQ
jgi:Competence protein CoiA-like family